MTVRYLLAGLALISLAGSCRAQKPVERKRQEPVAVVKQKYAVLSPEQRAELRLPPDLIAKIELAAGAEAEPFFVTVVLHSENLKGEQAFESRKLAGFSVRTKNGDELIDSYRAGLRVQGYLIFKSHKGYGSLADIVTVIRGNNSYDILKIQGTEAQNYQLDTKAIIAWLKARQQEGTFVVTGAGTDWLEARFIKAPPDMEPFAKKVAAFAPDVLEHGPRTSGKLAERMKKSNGFLLVWD
jgi:hypothetical protein